MYLVYIYIRACQLRVTVGDSGLCCCVCVTSFELELTPLFVDSSQRKQTNKQTNKTRNNKNHRNKFHTRRKGWNTSDPFQAFVCLHQILVKQRSWFSPKQLQRLPSLYYFHSVLPPPPRPFSSDSNREIVPSVQIAHHLSQQDCPISSNSTPSQPAKLSHQFKYPPPPSASETVPSVQIAQHLSQQNCPISSNSPPPQPEELFLQFK